MKGDSMLTKSGHNGHYHTEQYKNKQRAKQDRNFGPVEEHTKECKRCGKSFTFEARLKTKKYERTLYCSRSCANNRSDWWQGKAVRYRTICFQNHPKECIVCGFDKIVEVHHRDHNHSNNEPMNLIPLCPNHHQMLHSKKYNNEVTEGIDTYIGGLV
jgi:hypothetical protein|tara:strand:- start:28 stop:498 length:471 start_codon:yes stop_codon:yes gene_type:complete